MASKRSKGGESVKIKSIYLESFGKFQDYRVDFEDGINVIYGNNESGKSTIHQFIGAMFYGFVKPNLRHTRFFEFMEDYEPIDRDLYRGKIEFKYEGMHYELERDFHTKTYTLFDKHKNEDKTRTLTSRDRGLDAPGKVFFNMEYSAFSNLLYFAQNHRDFTISDTEMMEASIRNLIESHGNGYSLEGALKYLDRLRTEIGSKKNPERTLGRLELRRRELEVKRRLIEKRLIDHTSIIMRYRELNNEMQQKQAKIEATDSAINRNVRAQCALLEKEKSRIKEYLDHTKRRIDEIEEDLIESEDIKLFQELNATETRLKEKENLVTDRLVALKENIEAIEAKKIPDNPDLDLTAFDEIEKQMEMVRLKRKKSVHVNIRSFFFFLSAIFAISSLVYALLYRTSYAFIGLGPAALFALLGFLTRIKEPQDVDDPYVKSLSEIYRRHGVNDREAFLKIALSKKNMLLDYYSNIRYLEKLRQEYAEVAEVKRKIDIDQDANDQDHHYLYEKYDVANKKEMNNRIMASEELPFLKKKQEKLQTEYTYVNDFYDALLQGPENAASRMNSLLATKDLLESKKKLHEQLHVIEREAGELKGRMDSLEDEYDHFEALNSDLAQLDCEIEKYERELKRINDAKYYLGEAASALGSKATPRIQEAADKFFSITTGRMERKILISPSLEIYLDDGHHRVPLRQLSEGTKEQVYFSIRMALTESIASHMPLFFDESFVHYDKNRFINAFALLNTLGRTRQVLVFTSDYDEVLNLKKQNNDVNFIELR